MGSERSVWPPGSVFAGAYRIIGLIARGGMCDVYRAEEVAARRPVALKLLPARWNTHPVMIARLRREVEIAGRIEHVNVCRAYEYGECDGQHFAAMEYVGGEDLGTWLRRVGTPPRPAAAHIARQICAGLAAVHAAGVVHRDLKPSNVLLALDAAGANEAAPRGSREQGEVALSTERPDLRPVAKLSDFGVARVIGESAGAEASLGSPAYMAPEQLLDGQTSLQSDIYTLGLLLYELFVGRRYFATDALAELKRLHALELPEQTSMTETRLDPALGGLLNECLRRDPRRRPPAVTAVAERLAKVGET